MDSSWKIYSALPAIENKRCRVGSCTRNHNTLSKRPNGTVKYMSKSLKTEEMFYISNHSMNMFVYVIYKNRMLDGL
jgi:hypothetical protein